MAFVRVVSQVASIFPRSEECDNTEREAEVKSCTNLGYAEKLLVDKNFVHICSVALLSFKHSADVIIY